MLITSFTPLRRVLAIAEEYEQFFGTNLYVVRHFKMLSVCCEKIDNWFLIDLNFTLEREELPMILEGDSYLKEWPRLYRYRMSENCEWSEMCSVTEVRRAEEVQLKSLKEEHLKWEMKWRLRNGK